MSVRAFYLDASALAKRYVAELGTPLVDHLFNSVSPDRLYVFNVSMAEVVSALVRKRNTGLISAAAFSQGLIHFSNEIIYSAYPEKVAADNLLVTTAIPLIQAHSIN